MYPGGKTARDPRSRRAGHCQHKSSKPASRLLAGSCRPRSGRGRTDLGLARHRPEGEVHIGPGLVVSRLREVEVHHVDLDYGYKPEDWPFEWVMEEMDRAMLDLPSRLPPGEAVVLTATDADQHWVAGSGDATEVTGPTAQLFAWVIGRASHVNGVECPDLAPWR